MQKKLMVGCWNSWLYNSRSDYELFRMISKAMSRFEKENDAVFCVQEARRGLVELFRQSSSYKCFFCLDCIHQGVFSKEKKPSYLMVICKANMDVKSRTIKFEDKKRSFLQKIGNWEEGIEFLEVKIKKGGSTVKVVNSHLSAFVTSNKRLHEFEQVIEHLDDNTIICGDFNVFEKWLSYLPWNHTQERKAFDDRFSELKLKNIFKGHITFPSFGMQYDHILVPSSIDLKSKKMKRRFGSDHRWLECVLLL